MKRRPLIASLVLSMACLIAAVSPLTAVFAQRVPPQHGHVVLGGTAEQQQRALAAHVHHEDSPAHVHAAGGQPAASNGSVQVYSLADGEALATTATGVALLSAGAAPALVLPPVRTAVLSASPRSLVAFVPGVPHPPPRSVL